MLDQKPYRVHVCFGPNCARFHPKDLLRALEDEVDALNLTDQVSIQVSACRQRCEQSPSLNVYPGPTLYNRLTPDAVRQIVRQHFTGGGPVTRYLFRPGGRPPAAPAPAPSRPDQQPRKHRWW